MSVKMFDDKTKLEIVNYLKTHNKTQTAKRYNCSIRTIGRIVNANTSNVVTKQEPAPLPEKATSNLEWSMGPTYINIVKSDGTIAVANDTHVNFKAAAEKLLSGEVESALDMIDIKNTVMKYSDGKITIDEVNEIVYYNDIKIDTNLTRKIIASIKERENIDHLINFFEKLMENTSRRAVYELFGFLQHNDIEIGEDGDFYAWKRVNTNYTDMYTGEMDNSVGSTVRMERNKVNDDPTQTCSQGLHVAAKSYIPMYNGGSGRIIKCKVNPKNVVSVPIDYNNAKMRCCEYVVVEDVTAPFNGI